MTEITQYPDAVLTHPVYMVAEEDFYLLPELAFEMRKAMSEHHGVGIAANQIGVNRAVCLVKDKTLVNPRFIRLDDRSVSYEIEGCLSVDHSKKRILRPAYKAVTVEHLTVLGKKRITTFKGIEARIVQHEVRHLEGRLINEGLENKDDWDFVAQDGDFLVRDIPE